MYFFTVTVLVPPFPRAPRVASRLILITIVSLLVSGKLSVVALPFISMKQFPFVVIRQVMLLVDPLVISCVIVVSVPPVAALIL